MRFGRLLGLLFVFALSMSGIIHAANTSPVAMNLGGVVDYASDITFVDLIKSARTWISQEKGQPWGKGPAIELDQYGWVKSLQPNQFVETVVYTNFGQHYPAGKYTCLYDGDGDVDVTGDAKVVERTPGKLIVEIKPNHGSTFLRITRTNSDNYVRNIRLVHPGHEQTYEQQPFHPDFLKRWPGFAAYRFMDWQRTNGSPLVKWSDRTTPKTATQAVAGGVALEYLIQLANVNQTPPWFCMPHQADDDFVRQFATMVKRDLKSNLKIYIEYSNECWNGSFQQAKYCQTQGQTLKLGNSPFEAQLHYYAQRSVEIFKIWEDVFGGRERLVRVLATQSANPWTGTTVMDWKDAYKSADAIAIAPYFGHEFGNPKNVEQTLKLSPEQLVEACRSSLAKRNEATKKYAAEAQKRNLQLVAYEGGQHLVGIQGAENNEALTKLFHETNRHPKMKDLYLEDMRAWREAGGGLFCVFSSMGGYSKWGSWGVLENTAQNPADVPKYQAIQEFIRENK